jgi:hypothetical protein
VDNTPTPNDCSGADHYATEFKMFLITIDKTLPGERDT